MNGIDQAVIIAAGTGIGLGQLTKDRPKAMLPVLGKPIVVRVMDRIHEAGIQHFVVVVGENEGEVASYFNGGWVPDCKVQIVLQPSPRGPADALLCASNYITGPFLLASCNHLAPGSQITTLVKRFQAGSADMVLSVVPFGEDTAGLPGVKANEDLVTSISLEPATQRRSLSAFMLYACGKRILNHTNASTSTDAEIANAVQSLIASGARVGFATADWHMQLNREVDLLTINKRFLREGRDTHILSEIPGSVHIIPPVRIDPQVSVGQGAKIGPNVYLESGAHVGQEAVIWDSVVLKNADIASREVVHGQIVGRRLRISEEITPETTRTRRPPGLDEYLASEDERKK
jgi:NDP-sugar pyrophosphorylase family protein